MPLFGSLLSKGLKIGNLKPQKKKTPFELQKKELGKLLKKAKATQFGQHYHFHEILHQFGEKRSAIFYDFWSKRVPVFNYNKIFDEWWHRSKAGEHDVTWPGRVKYFALSSGTSEAATKHIPMTLDMLKANKKTSMRQMLTLSQYDLPPAVLGKGILMLGGSTKLTKIDTYYEGDLSGIQASKIPFWFQIFYKPGKRIAEERDWNHKLDEITKNAAKWDIAFIVGVPAWLQIMMERIIEHYGVKNIHEVWPNLSAFVHGGVSFEPYKKGFEKLLGRPITYIETYLASEGFIAFQVGPNKHSMKLSLDTGIFFEFIPFNEKNFTSEGEVVTNPETLMIHQVEEGVDYALLLSTCAGTWRYLIGDVIRFENKEECEIIISGRTKHYLSLCGEHLSVENMNKAIQLVSEELNISISEYTVAGISHGSLFAHKWYVGTDDAIDQEVLVKRLDDKLKELNDDYRTERIAALKDVFLEVLPVGAFYKWMESKGKVGSQNKFPRVMKKVQLEEWDKFVEQF
ncbi:MAG TPA: GH3 auxin-responsive promoter family protein, partial [Cytophagaceae bacterium]|nr:GH3 auxin-responsive promoter family protein [Cytophagaceae bacterium]